MFSLKALTPLEIRTQALPPPEALFPWGILACSRDQCSRECTCNSKDGIKENNTRKRVKLLGLWKSKTVSSNILPGGFPPSQALIQSVEGFGFEICLLNSETSYRLASTPSHEALSDSGFHLHSQSRKSGWWDLWVQFPSPYHQPHRTQKSAAERRNVHTSAGLSAWQPRAITAGVSTIQSPIGSHREEHGLISTKSRQQPDRQPEKNQVWWTMSSGLKGCTDLE